MLSAPKIRLRTIFLILLCASVGLTCASAHHAQKNSAGAFGFYVPNLDVHYALLTTAATAMVIGLVSQARQLAHSHLSQLEESKNLRFAATFAIAWQIAIALLITSCLVIRVLVMRQLISLSSHDSTFSEHVLDAVLDVAIIVVLSDSIRRRLPQRPAQSSKLNWIAWPISIVLALLILPEKGLVTYLVHVATQGIELAQPLRFRRPGIFPNQFADHFRLFWLSFAAVSAIALATTLLTAANRLRRAGLATRAALSILSLTLLVPCAIFCRWFYQHVYASLSPDLASGGFENGQSEVAFAGVLVLFIGTIGAYRLALTEETGSFSLESDNAKPDERAIHETPLVLALLIGSSLLYFFENVRALIGIPRFMGTVSSWEVIGYLVHDSDCYIVLAMLILILQLFRICWKQCRQSMPWNLRGVAPLRFFLNAIALSALLAVAIPTVAIYCFTYWLGPWYLYSPR